MTMPKLKPWEMPGWPLWLDSRMAAAYVGLGVEKFREEVYAGLWPSPKRPSLWYRPDLDSESAAKASGPAVNQLGDRPEAGTVEDLGSIREQMKARVKAAQ